MESETGDLADRLAGAAHAAVLNQRPSLQHDPASVKSLTVELTLDRAGAIQESEAYIGRRVSLASILGKRGG